MSPARHDRGSESLVNLDPFVTALVLGCGLLFGLVNLGFGLAEGNAVNLVAGVIGTVAAAFGLGSVVARLRGGAQE